MEEKIKEKEKRVLKDAKSREYFGETKVYSDSNIFDAYELGEQDKLAEVSKVIDKDFELLKKIYCEDWVDNQCNYNKGCEECNKIDKFKEELKQKLK